MDCSSCISLMGLWKIKVNNKKDLEINGHALELRVYAEDPLNNFLPSVGTLTRYKKPEGEGVRLDDGYEEGMEIHKFNWIFEWCYEYIVI